MRTVRQRFTALYSTVFLGSAAVLLLIANVVASNRSAAVRTAPDGTASVPSVQLADAQAQIATLQAQLNAQEADTARRLLVGSVVALAVMALASIVLGRFVAGRVLRPLRAMTAATRRISADNLHERLAVRGPDDEVKGLADTIDALLHRLEGAFAAERRFVANASHELRTPLATMRASLDVAAAKPDRAPQTVALADRLRTELDHMDRLLEGLLVLARAQNGELPERATVVLGRVVSSALDARADEIAARGLDVHATGDDVRVRGNRTLLLRMADNLIDNGIRHNDPGGWMRVAVNGDATKAVLVVETGGPELDPAQVAALGRPFRRLGGDRIGAGTGLGLSIVRAVAAAHGGALELRARPGGGLRAEVALPGTSA
ncbi:sensor histidine kinase [Actinomadura rayongensis]|uniref:histidine kinase n=1 Tax=Actinomadura rayongensis TaxID=1429076 RepID=A0A6I4WAP2_9ACTN|nr:HAMP domain-containing sensor histidine kinase [Actinomadura rayongensis]MXQ63792.1 HAMP domain-containing protein [Actinomadura rayongensis]